MKKNMECVISDCHVAVRPLFAMTKKGKAAGNNGAPANGLENGVLNPSSTALVLPLQNGKS
jgi:hypothetical protein